MKYTVQNVFIIEAKYREYKKETRSNTFLIHDQIFAVSSSKEPHRSFKYVLFWGRNVGIK
jgi:hypothetical protein